MQRIINREITKTIDMKLLGQLLPKYCKVSQYDRVKGKSLSEVMGKHTVLVLLWNIHDKKHRVLDKPGHFFVISTRGPESCVVFSSTGMTPKKELFLTQSDPTLLDRILPKGTVYNNIKLQVSKDSNTCWRYAILFAHLAPMGLKKFQSLFSKPNMHINTSDQLATALTFMSLY